MAVLLVVVIVCVVLDLKLGGQVIVVGVYSARSCREGRVAVLLSPLVEDTGEKGWVAKLDFFVVGLDDDLLIEVILDCVA